VQTGNAGVYSVSVSNSTGSVISSNVSLAVTASTSLPQLSGSVYANGTFSLTVNGDGGHSYIIQTSTNLTDWTSVFTNPMPSLPFVWSDPGANNSRLRFYRIQVGP
jgi:hypothetical protein